MALDWNKEISFNDLFKKRGKQSDGDYPTKTTINLYKPAATGPKMTTIVPTAILLVLLVAAFTKFGVLDQWAKVAAKEAELAKVQSQVATVEAKLAGYNELLEEYESYAPLLSASGIDASAVLTMVENYVMPTAAVSSATLEGSTLTLNLVGVSLETVGRITNGLQAQSIVSNVAVTTAQNDRTDASSMATLQVSLVSSTDGLGSTDSTVLGIDPNASAQAWAGAVGALSKN